MGVKGRIRPLCENPGPLRAVGSRPRSRRPAGPRRAAAGRRPTRSGPGRTSSGPAVGQQPHRLVGRRHHLGAERGLQLRRAAARPPRRAAGHPAAQPPAGQPGGGRERRAVQAGDGAQQRVLHLAGRPWLVELAQPGLLAVPPAPGEHGVAQVVQLHAAVVGAGPHVGQRAAQLGVPHQRRQVLEHDRHADVVDRAVGASAGSPGRRRVRPRKSHTSPVRVRSTAASRVSGGTCLPYGSRPRVAA